jgi:ubiquinol-cytochrome c reductase iron-sulfur subunit
MAAAGFGAVAVGGAAWPLIASMAPARDVPPLYPVTVDVRDIPVGQSASVVLMGKLVFIRHRTPAEIAAARSVPLSELRDSETDAARAAVPEWLVVDGLCPYNPVVLHGQRPNEHRGAFGGWFCIHCASHFDTAGRVRKGPAQRNMRVVEYDFLDDVTLGLRSARRLQPRTG